MYKFNLFYVVYCTSCKETSITTTDSVEIEIENFQQGIDTYCAAESFFHMNAQSKTFSHVSHYYSIIIIRRLSTHVIWMNMYFEYFLNPSLLPLQMSRFHWGTSYMQHQGAAAIFGDTQNNSSTHIAEFCAQSQWCKYKYFLVRILFCP